MEEQLGISTLRNGLGIKGQGIKKSEEKVK